MATIENSHNKKRDTSLDAVCGLFIIYMIITHAFQWSNARDDDFYINIQYGLFMFMPWFFYKSGMYHRQTDVKVAFNHGIKRLVIPFIVYSAVGELVLWFRQYQQVGTITWRNLIKSPIRDLVLQGSLSGNLALWFLLSLFLVKLLMSVVDKYKINYNIILLMALAVSGETVRELGLARNSQYFTN